MARAPKPTIAEEAPPRSESAASLRDELLAAASAALAVGDHAAHALSDSLLQDVVGMRSKIAMAPEFDGEIAALIAKLKAIL